MPHVDLGDGPDCPVPDTVPVVAGPAWPAAADLLAGESPGVGLAPVTFGSAGGARGRGAACADASVNAVVRPGAPPAMQ